MDGEMKNSAGWSLPKGKGLLFSPPPLALPHAAQLCTVRGAFVWACWPHQYWVCSWSMSSPGKAMTAVGELRVNHKSSYKGN